jgi:phosphoribosylformylglycinamidine synthase
LIFIFERQNMSEHSEHSAFPTILCDSNIDLALSHGLSREEYGKITSLMERTPNVLELGIFSAMWNEHCSYKSSRVWLEQLPTQAPWVVQGPGENAGIISLNDDLCLAFKVESHNHPTQISPFHGAETGVGGILRDIFTMGARPIALMNILCFGDLAKANNRYLLASAVSGIGGYGNAFGVPNIGGKLIIHPTYDNNCLVNAFAAGLVNKSDIQRASPQWTGKKTGMLVVCFGSKTGRDGLGGSTMASAEFTSTSDDGNTASRKVMHSRTTVQVGDPFMGKCLMEACLELASSGTVIAIQDMGAAGLTCSAVEMGDKGDIGITLSLDRVPCRSDTMSPYDIMLSESQERMLMIIHPNKLDTAHEILNRWGLEFAVIGETTAKKTLKIFYCKESYADIPIHLLSKEVPKYRHSYSQHSTGAQWADKTVSIVSALKHQTKDTLSVLKTLINTPELCSKRWIWEQYDHTILCNTIHPPGFGNGVVRVGDKRMALAFSTGVVPSYCLANPQEGGKAAVVHAYRNLRCLGARPLAITNCLNFGSPRNPDIMGQFVGCVLGMGEACKELDFPIISGNVSLYNQTEGCAIHPTPVICGVGLIENMGQLLNGATKYINTRIVMIGQTMGHLEGSLYMRHIHQDEEGCPPLCDFQKEQDLGRFIDMANSAGLLVSCRGISRGGLAVASSRMALAGNIGIALHDFSILPRSNAIDIHPMGWYFGEDQGRCLCEIFSDKLEEVSHCAAMYGLSIKEVGYTQSNHFSIGELTIPLATLNAIFESHLPDAMNA